MADRARLSIYAVDGQRGFADAIAAGLRQRHAEPGLGLARTTLILPNRRAVRAMTEAFVRDAEGGLLLPRMVVIGDLALDEKLGAWLDPLADGAAIPPAADPLTRLARFAGWIQDQSPQHTDPVAALALARSFAEVLDELAVADHGLADLDSLDLGDLARHWQDSIALFRTVAARWAEDKARMGLIDAAERRNRLLDAAAARWQRTPPEHPVVAAGITTAAPAIARLLKVIARLDTGTVILPGLDLGLGRDIWDALGPVGAALADPDADAPAYGHPQYHLKWLLDAMSIDRDSVLPWAPPRRSGDAADRARLVRSLFLPARLSDRWQSLDAADRRTKGIRLVTLDTPDHEAQAVALLARATILTPRRRVAIVTPDRALASRIVAHLARWGIAADDSAGEPLSVTPPGTLLLGMAACIGEAMAPVPLMALLKHPLVEMGEARLAWLDGVRMLDLALRGPRPAPGLAGIDAAVAAGQGLGCEDRAALRNWWSVARDRLAALDIDPAEPPPRLAALIARIVTAAGALAPLSAWSGPAGRAAADLVEALASDVDAAALSVAPARLGPLLRGFFDDVAVRPDFGQHPRIALYGLLEARLQSADLVICAGLNEGVWPQQPAPDPVLAPAVRRMLGLPAGAFRIGLSAADLAGALQAPELVLTRAARDGGAPSIASRFVLRLQAVAGTALADDPELAALAAALDQRLPSQRIARPQPQPNAVQRGNHLSVTAVDRLRADPFAYYARAILGLKPLDPVDADPGPAWQGQVVHAILDLWNKQDEARPDALLPRAEAFLAAANIDPLVKSLWRPRLLAGLKWVAAHNAALRDQGRGVIDTEKKGRITIDGVKLEGTADRIDWLADGTLGIVDFKIGQPPSASQVESGFALQLGLLGLIAERGGFEGLQAPVRAFEYWSLARARGGDGFGYADTPLKIGAKRVGLDPEEMIPVSEAYLREALARWIIGDEPFTAKLVPDQARFNDYDQLMRLDEWYGRLERAE